MPITVNKGVISINENVLKYYFEEVLDEFQCDSLESIMERDKIQLRNS